MTELMTVQEAADYLRVTKKTIYRLLRQGKIPATKVGKQWRFDRAAIDEWLRQGSSPSGAAILVIDDEESVRLLFKQTLEEEGHRVVAAENGFDGLEQVKQQDFDLVFLDLKMPGMVGDELFGRIKAIKPRLPVTIISGYPDSGMMKRAMAQGPFGVMGKPFGAQDIITAVANFLHFARG